MSKVLLVSMVFLAVLAAVLGGYLLLSGIGSIHTDPFGQDTSEIEVVFLGKTIYEILDEQRNLKCDYTGRETGTGGKVYLTNNLLRGDFSGTTINNSASSHFIITNGEYYIWQDDEETGYRSTVSTSENMFREVKLGSKPPSAGELADYNCVPWEVDNTYFVPPVDVKFQDFDLVQAGLWDKVGKQLECAYCDAIDDETGAAECRKLRGC